MKTIKIIPRILMSNNLSITVSFLDSSDIKEFSFAEFLDWFFDMALDTEISEDITNNPRNVKFQIDGYTNLRSNSVVEKILEDFIRHYNFNVKRI